MTKSSWLLAHLWLVLCMAALLGPVAAAQAGNGCSGDAECTSCQNCRACQHCARHPEATCGLRERLYLLGDQHNRAPFAGTWNVVSFGGASREETLQPDGSALTVGEGVGRWNVTGGRLLVHFDDPVEEQQSYGLSNKEGPLSGQDQAGHALIIQRHGTQPVPVRPDPATTTVDAMPVHLSVPPGSSPTDVCAEPTATRSVVPLSTCVAAIASQSDPARLGTLGQRATNPRLKRILYYLAAARDGGADPGEVITAAQRANGSLDTPRAPLVKASLLRNLKICDGLGLLTPENRSRLRHGAAPVVTRGPYLGEPAHVDHIVPLAHAGGIDNELANLEMLPRSLNCAKGAKVGDRQLDYARRFREAGLISEANLINLQMRHKLGGTAKYELPEP